MRKDQFLVSLDNHLAHQTFKNVDDVSRATPSVRSKGTQGKAVGYGIKVRLQRRHVSGNRPAARLAERLQWCVVGRPIPLADATGAAPDAFARGIKRDHGAVLAALVELWSTGPVEGGINRLKLFKRTMYGRAKCDLLRCRVLAAA